MELIISMCRRFVGIKKVLSNDCNETENTSAEHKITSFEVRCICSKNKNGKRMKSKIK